METTLGVLFLTKLQEQTPHSSSFIVWSRTPWNAQNLYSVYRRQRRFFFYPGIKTWQNSKCRLSDDRDETINHIISECYKLAQKEYKTRHDWVGKGIHRELCKKLKFDHTNKWYMHDPESVLENEIHKLFWDFKIQTDLIIFVRWLDLVIIKKKREPAE